jgi:hypothetical protein
MKLTCGPTYYEKQVAKKEWHLWYAWYPVRLPDNTCRWLEYISRRGTYFGYTDIWEWEYRET